MPATDDLHRLRGAWDLIIQVVFERHPAAIGTATRLLPVTITNDCLLLTSDGPRQDDSDCDDALQVIASEARRILGRNIEVRVDVHPAVTSTPVARSEAYQAAAQHPVVKTLIEAFNAEIIGREPSPRQQWLQRRQADAINSDPDDVPTNHGGFTDDG